MVSANGARKDRRRTKGVDTDETQENGGADEQPGAPAGTGRATTPAASGTPGTIADGSTVELDPETPPADKGEFEHDRFGRPEGGLGGEDLLDPDNAGQQGH